METVRRGSTSLHPEHILFLIILENLKLWTPIMHNTEDDLESLHDLTFEIGIEKKRVFIDF